MASSADMENLRSKVIELSERDTSIEYIYIKPVALSKLIGLYKIKVNDFSFNRALRFTDVNGNFPSFSSFLRYPGILVKYLLQKITKKYVVNDPKPFLVTDAVDFIEKHIEEGSRVLEVGAGNSTIWFLAHGCRVTSFEHNRDWARDIEESAKRLKKHIPSMLEIQICEGDEAINSMALLDCDYDVILIDSMNAFTSRFEAIRVLKEKLSPGGILVLDNSDGVVNWKALAEMDGVISKRFTGYAYNCPVVCETTIWSASDIKKSQQ